MTILLFIFILLVLVVGHEFGHFIAAKFSRMDVPEFGVGFPPKLFGKKIGSTEYTINALPFGGFVRITGEDGGETKALDPSAFSSRPKYQQFLTLFAGPASNILIALVLSSLAFMAGVPAAAGGPLLASRITDAKTTILDVLPNSPSAKAGLKAGDQIVSIEENGDTRVVHSPTEVSDLIEKTKGPLTINLVRNSTPMTVSVLPQKGIVAGKPDKNAIGIATGEVGILKLPFLDAIHEGFKETLWNFKNILLGLLSLLGHAFTFSANVSDVAGPVGIAHLVGSAAAFGLGSILSFAALLSINLGIINLFPFPALDGGRIAFLLAETISRKKITPRFASVANGIGFALLITLMIAVTAHDIFRLVG